MRKHDCVSYFEDTGGMDFDGVYVFIRGSCTECGRGLTQVYAYLHTVDNVTEEIVDVPTPPEDKP